VGGKPAAADGGTDDEAGDDEDDVLDEVLAFEGRG
jgi:hypothetical protein